MTQKTRCAAKTQATCRLRTTEGLNVEHVDFEYSRHRILSDVSFRVKPGEIVAVLGPNGSGKSTLFRCLNGILKKKRGTVRLCGENVANSSAETVARKIAYVPQRIEATPLSVFDAVLLGRKPYFTWFAAEKDYEAVERILARLELASFAHRPLDRLSGGEIQKVALARALVQEPDLLLLDEPTSALDLKNQVGVLSMLRETVRERNIMAVLSMHDINIAIRYADRFLLLRQGTVVGDVRQDGLTPEMIEQVYGLPVEIHTSNRDMTFVIERLTP